MKAQLPQPFEQEDIRKDPKAVVIGLLIGLLLMALVALAALYQQKEKEQERLYNIIIDERNQRIKNYEGLLFYRRKAVEMQMQDSILRDKTDVLVEKLLK